MARVFFFGIVTSKMKLREVVPHVKSEVCI